MLELADIIRQFGLAYVHQYHNQLLPSHQRVLHDIEHCRTEQMGGHLYACTECGGLTYSYHSCKNRHCPKCQQDEVQQWLARQQTMLLPTPYFLVTFTLPQKLRKLARAHQKTVYSIMFHASAEALQKLARDPHYLGARIGMIGILHTWARDLAYHPHIHYLVPAGGISEDGTTWIKARYKNFLVPVKALSKMFKAIMLKKITHAGLGQGLDKTIRKNKWVVHSQKVGHGERALRYLAPYVFRVALTNNRLISINDDRVTYRICESTTKKWKSITINALTFIQRFLQHVLPRGFVKVRYYGLFSPRFKTTRTRVIIMLNRTGNIRRRRTTTTTLIREQTETHHTPLRCPHCGGILRYIDKIDPPTRAPP
jgi:predicted Zn-ribbon and HTH transcriptional regulator